MVSHFFKFVLTLLPVLSMVAGQLIEGATECTSARGFDLCQNFVTTPNVTEWQLSTHIRSTSASIAWSTEYVWNDSTDYTPKSYANVDSKAAKGLQIKILPVLTAAWSWEYMARSNLLRAVVGMDIWIGAEKTRPPGTTTSKAFEIRIWLASAGGIKPPGSMTVEAPCIAGYDWSVWRSVKGNIQTITFVNLDESDSDITQFDGDLGEFIDYLTEAVKIPSSYYIQSIRAGNEVYSGAAHFVTSICTLWVEYPED